jgi:hypothetical protein
MPFAPLSATYLKRQDEPALEMEYTGLMHLPGDAYALTARGAAFRMSQVLPLAAVFTQHRYAWGTEVKIPPPLGENEGERAYAGYVIRASRYASVSFLPPRRYPDHRAGAECLL